MLLLFLYGLWLAFNARVTPDTALSGVPAVALIYWLCLRLLQISPRRDLLLLRALPGLCAFFLHLLWDVLRSALRVIRLIVSRREPEPCLVTFDPELKTGAGRVMLADAITLTPGTITVEAGPRAFTVHCLDRRAGDGAPGDSVAESIRRLETAFPSGAGAERKGGLDA